MRLALTVCAFAALAGCAEPPAPPTPVGVTLHRQTVVVAIRPGGTCSGLRARGQETGTGWRGTLEGCAAPYRYEVTLRKGRNPVRLVLEKGLDALGGADLLAPRAQVTIRGPQGRVWRFASPPSEG